MQRVALISLYDEFCLPLRYASSLMQRDGHHVQMIFVRGLSYASPHQIPAAEERGEGGYYGYLSFISQTEQDALIQSLKTSGLQLIGLHVSPLHYGLAAHLSRVIKDTVNIPVVWSGVDPSLNPDAAIEHADFIISGECDDAYLELCNTLETNGDLTKIANIWAKKDGQVYKNNRRPLRDNLDEYPFADFEWANKKVLCDDAILDTAFPAKSPLHTNFVTRISRGCPIENAYYFHGLDDAVYMGDTRVRRRSAANIVAELKHRVRTWRTPLQRIDFYDPCLPTHNEDMLHFVEEMGSEIGLPYSGYVHPATVDFDTLPTLCYYGLDHLILSIPSGSERTLNQYYANGINRQIIMDCVQQIKKAGLKFVLEVLGYNPLENDEDKKETLSLLCDLPKPYGMKRVLPTAFLDGFPLTGQAKNAGIIDQLERPEGVHGMNASATADDIFWEMIFTLGHLNNFTKEHVMNFTQDTYMREHPQLFSEYIENMYNATYAFSNPLLDKDEYVGHMRWKIAQLEKSPVYRAYHKVKTLVR
jgi:hypothetical protein